MSTSKEAEVGQEDAGATNQSINRSLFANEISSKQQKKEMWQPAITGNSPAKLAT